MAYDKKRKTYTAGEKATSYENPILVACQKSKVDDWVNHFRTHYPHRRAFDLSKAKDAETFICESRSGNQVVGVVSYDTLWRRPALLKLKNLTLICDESSLISNEQAKRTKAIVRMKRKGQLAHVVLLSGTPIDGKYERLVSQAWLLGWEIPKKEFWARYVETRDLWLPGQSRPIQTVSGYRNVDELKRNLREHGASFLTVEDCLHSLPSQTFVHMETKPPTAYKKMEKDSICEINGEELVGNDLLSKRLYAHCTTGGENAPFTCFVGSLTYPSQKVGCILRFKEAKMKFMRVQVGAYTKKATLEEAKKILADAGFDTFSEKVDGTTRLFCGSFKTVAKAMERLEQVQSVDERFERAYLRGV